MLGRKNFLSTSSSISRFSVARINITLRTRFKGDNNITGIAFVNFASSILKGQGEVPRPTFTSPDQEKTNALDGDRNMIGEKFVPNVKGPDVADVESVKKESETVQGSSSVPNKQNVSSEGKKSNLETQNGLGTEAIERGEQKDNRVDVDKLKGKTPEGRNV